MLKSALGLLPLLFVAPAFAQDAPGHDQAIGQQFHITAESLEDVPANVPEGQPPKIIERGEHMPIVPPGFTAQLFVEGMTDPRRIAIGFDGVVYIAQQSTGGIIALYDRDGDGAADRAGGVIQGAANPFGLDFFHDGDFAGDLILGDQDGIYRLPINTGGTSTLISPEGAFGPAAGHITREVAIDQKSQQIYVGVGSMANLDTGEPPMKATIQRFNADGTGQMTFATGLRNATGLAFEPRTNALYAVVMERDGMGDELVPDYLTKVSEGDFFGWPYQYIGGHVQPEFRDGAPKMAAAKTPDVLFEAHSAPLDIAFVPDTWPEAYRGDALVALHGSSGAGEPRGYKVVLVHFKDGVPDGTYENFMTGFWVSGTAPAEVWGRPASLAFDRDGSLLVGDDAGSTIWRVTPPKE